MHEAESCASGQAGVERALFSLAPAQSKRIIAKAVAALPEVRAAMASGLVVVANGTTNAFVVEELMGDGSRLEKVRYGVGVVTGNKLGEVPPGVRYLPFVFDHGVRVPMEVKDGKVVDMRSGERFDSPLGHFISKFKKGDIFIKGANAIDPSGKAGVLSSHPSGGSIGATMGTIYARGSHLIVPAGLEKLIPSVEEASASVGQAVLDYSIGNPAGLIPLVNGRIVTELQALAVLAGVRAVHVASGGILGGEGAVVISVAGSPSEIRACLALVKETRNEPQLRTEEEPISLQERLPSWW